MKLYSTPLLLRRYERPRSNNFIPRLGWTLRGAGPDVPYYHLSGEPATANHHDETLTKFEALSVASRTISNETP